jgi:glycosyltransferase involved in cell wall biosynthesis
MLVSASIDAGLREQVRLGLRPRPEYLELEGTHGFKLLDWSQLGRASHGRGIHTSLAHTAAALRALPSFDGVLSDGEHVGVPMALGLRALRRRTPHVVIGHHVSSRAKRMIFRFLQPQRAMSRLVLHSPRQLELAHTELGLTPSLVRLLPYGVDHVFWTPREMPEEPLVVSAGREHRDFRTLAGACGGLEASVLIARGSLHSPTAICTEPDAWPANFSIEHLAHFSLREAYARAAVTVVPLLETDFQAGVTTLLEAMAMGKAVVVSDTAGLRGLVEDSVTALTVPPGDPWALRNAVVRLLANPRERARLGANARASVESNFALDAYAAGLANQLRAVTSDPTGQTPRTRSRRIRPSVESGAGTPP